MIKTPNIEWNIKNKQYRYTYSPWHSYLYTRIRWGAHILLFYKCINGVKTKRRYKKKIAHIPRSRRNFDWSDASMDHPRNWLKAYYFTKEHKIHNLFTQLHQCERQTRRRHTRGQIKLLTVNKHNGSSTPCTTSTHKIDYNMWWNAQTTRWFN